MFRASEEFSETERPNTALMPTRPAAPGRAACTPSPAVRLLTYDVGK